MDRWKNTGSAEFVETLTGVYRKHLQSIYTGLQKSLHQEWSFVKRVTPFIGDAFFLGRRTGARVNLPAIKTGGIGPYRSNLDGP